MPDMRLVNIPGTGALIYGDQGSGTRAAADFINWQKDNTEVFSVDYQGLPDPGGNQAVWQVRCGVGDIVANSDALDITIFEARSAITISKIEYAVDTATADGSTNGQTLLISESGAAAAVASIATPTANPGVAQATWTTMGSITHPGLVAGEYLYLSPTVVSSGLAMSGLVFLITYTMTN